MTNSNEDDYACLLRYYRQTLCRYAQASDLSRVERNPYRPCYRSWKPLISRNGYEVAGTTPLPEEIEPQRNSGRISQHVTAAYATVSNMARQQTMSMKDLLIGAIAATAVVGAVVATPILLKAPIPPKPVVLKADKESIVQPPMNEIYAPPIRTIPLTKPVAVIKPEEKPPDEDTKPEVVPAPLAPAKEETRVEQEVELPARRHYGDGSDICRRTGGWKVSTGKGWRCRYRR